MINIPDLKLTHSKIKDSFRFDLKRFLYSRSYNENGKTINSKKFLFQIESGVIQPDKTDRIGLILEIKDVLDFMLTSGRSISTIDTALTGLQAFFDFIDLNGILITLENLIDSYMKYCEYLFVRSNINENKIKKITAYHYAYILSKIFGMVLGLDDYNQLIKKTRIKIPSMPKKAVSRRADKQNLEETSIMGAFLVDLASGITIDRVLGPIPMQIPIRGGLIVGDHVVIGGRWYDKNKEDMLLEPWEDLGKNQRNVLRNYKKSHNSVDSITGTKRNAFVSLRVVVEIIIFIAQTGMNVTSAYALSIDNITFRPSGDKLQVRTFKSRRAGEVMFSIYKSYKPHLLEYIEFIKHFHPENQKLFPVFDWKGNPSSQERITYLHIIKLMKQYNIPWISPMVIRNTRANWFLRRSGGDEKITSEMMQHLQETLREKYELPSQQRTMVEITRFWMASDSIRKEELRDSLFLGKCSGQPESLLERPSTVLAPNCINFSGCLWCKNFRDIDSFDYIWTLKSFLYLKIIEASGMNSIDKGPVDIMINRITEKIDWFRNAGGERTSWVKECELRIAEGYYHPDWSGIIDFLEDE